MEAHQETGKPHSRIERMVAKLGSTQSVGIGVILQDIIGRNTVNPF